MDFIVEMKEKFGERFKEIEKLSRYTSFQIGGNARFFLIVQNIDEIVEAVGFAKKYGIEFLVLGGGSNVLISDSGFSGLVIKN